MRRSPRGGDRRTRAWTSTRSPIEAWATEAISRRYESFLRRWTPLFPAVAAGRVDGAAAVRARTGIMDTFARLADAAQCGIEAHTADILAGLGGDADLAQPSPGGSAPGRP